MRISLPRFVLGVVLGALAAPAVFGAPGSASWRAGVHDNPPFVVPSADGTPTGLLVELLEDVGASHGWTIEYVLAPAATLLEHLRAGRIDVVVGVGSTELRAAEFDFTAPVVEAPTEVLVHSGVSANNLSDLAGLRIAVAETDGHAEILAAQMGAYGVPADIRTFPSYASVAAALVSGRADAGIVTQQARAALPSLEPMDRSSVALNPVGVRFAFPRGTHSALREALDARVEREQSDHFSAFNRAMTRWMGDTIQGYVWRMLRRLLLVSIVAIMALTVLAVGLRHQIRRKTRELTQTNTQLRNEIAKRHQAQRRLEDSERYHRALIENSLEIVLMIDRDYIVQYVSPSVETVLGYGPDEVVGRPVWDWVHPEDVPVVRAAHDTGIKHPGVPHWSEFRVRDKHGGWRHLEAIGNNLLDHPVVGGIVANCRDITERRDAEAALKESEERFRALVEHAPEAIIVIDHATGRFEDVNDNAVQLFGFDRETLLGMHPSDLSPELQPDGTPSVVKFLDKMELALRGGTPVFEWTHRNASGEEFACEFRLLRLPSGDRQLVRGSITDITDRKRAEKVLENYRVELEDAVTARTEELAEKNAVLEHTLEQLRDTQDQLIINQKMASLGALTAGIAHEIKNPLNFVNNFADITAELVSELETCLAPHWAAMEDHGAADARDLLANIRTNTAKIGEHGRRADSIVRGMLLHSRGKAGERQTIDINALLDEYVKLAYHGMRAQNPKFNVTIQSDYDPAAGRITAVPQDLSRVFLNIVNNACYAAHERNIAEDGDFKPTLTIVTRDLGERVEIRVRDNGFGIPNEVRDRIFEPFYTTKPAGKGTGLGLSISYDIVVQEHHGELTVASEPGAFTEFCIVLPRKNEAPAPEGDTAHAESNGRR